MENTAMTLSKVIYVQGMMSLIQSGMGYDQISAVVTVCKLYAHWSVKIASLSIYNFVSVHYIDSAFIYLFNFLFNSAVTNHFIG